MGQSTRPYERTHPSLVPTHRIQLTPAVGRLPRQFIRVARRRVAQRFELGEGLVARVARGGQVTVGLDLDLHRLGTRLVPLALGLRTGLEESIALRRETFELSKEVVTGLGGGGWGVEVWFGWGGGETPPPAHTHRQKWRTVCVVNERGLVYPHLLQRSLKVMPLRHHPLLRLCLQLRTQLALELLVTLRTES